MLDWLSDGQVAALAGGFGGILLGLAARIGRFCTLGAIEDYLHGDSDTRLRMWGLAISLSILGTGALAAFGLFEPADTIYHSLGWNPLASIVGGLVFGYGMALTGFCGHGALARLGGGDMRAFVVVLVIAISAYMTMSGPFAYLRVWLFPVPEEPAGGLTTMLGIPFAATAVTLGLTGAAITDRCSGASSSPPRSARAGPRRHGSRPTASARRPSGRTPLPRRQARR